MGKSLPQSDDFRIDVFQPGRDVNRKGDTACGRCEIRVLVKLAESCWYCGSDLCYDCWDEHGHCGHEEAVEANRKAKLVPQPGEEEDDE